MSRMGVRRRRKRVRVGRAEGGTTPPSQSASWPNWSSGWRWCGVAAIGPLKTRAASSPVEATSRAVHPLEQPGQGRSADNEFRIRDRLDEGRRLRPQETHTSAAAVFAVGLRDVARP